MTHQTIPPRSLSDLTRRREHHESEMLSRSMSLVRRMIPRRPTRWTAIPPVEGWRDLLFLGETPLSYRLDAIRARSPASASSRSRFTRGSSDAPRGSCFETYHPRIARRAPKTTDGRQHESSRNRGLEAVAAARGTAGETRGMSTGGITRGRRGARGWAAPASLLSSAGDSGIMRDLWRAIWKRSLHWEVK